MFSNVLGWFTKSLLGISPCEDAPGFRRIRINPQFIKELGFVRGYEDTVMGRIEAEWEYRNGIFIYTVTLPEGISGEYMGVPLVAGKNTFNIKEQTQ
jgi:alpha-L-rhamnosidase